MDGNIGQQVAGPAPSSVPELEQVLIKIQELEQRIGDLELASAQDAQMEGHENPIENVQGTAEKLIKKFKEFSKAFKEADEITGTPEIEKDKKKENPEKAADAKVPQAITSEVGTPNKTGAPVAGEETGLDAGKKDDKAKDTEAEKDAVKKVPKPADDYPKDNVQKNALEQHPVKEAPEKPEEMEDEKGKKMPENKYETLYKETQKKMIEENLKRRALKESLQGRKTVVGVSASKGNPFVESKVTVKEYLHKAGIRI